MGVFPSDGATARERASNICSSDLGEDSRPFEGNDLELEGGVCRASTRASNLARPELLERCCSRIAAALVV